MDYYYIEGYKLDEYQINAIKCNNNLLLIAGAGSGKTSTILGKIKYLINNLNYKECEILCISLTNETVNNLSNKISNMGYKVDVKTFHKLGLDILKEYDNTYRVCNNNLLEYIVDEYFLGIVKYSCRKYLVYLLYKDYRYNLIINSKKFNSYKKDIITFINLVKNKGYDINYIYGLYRKSLKDKITYYFILEIFDIYTREIESTKSLDFNDMIIKACKLVKLKNIKLNYKYIIIDEFQDTSLIRLNLIRNIIYNNSAKLFCVGDDYQSIYKFNGSDINIFLKFKEYLKESTIIYLKNTYRNSIELVKVSSNFIMKNKYQIKKELCSVKSLYKPIIIIYCNNYRIGFKKLIKEVKYNAMIIGRNNKDIYNYIDKDEDINKYDYYTVHSSKGLESDNVILINLTNNYTGFPSKVKNSRIINTLLDKESYPYEEERRLFYVALTRTKNYVYILVNKNNISCFIKELLNDYKEFIEIKNDY